MVGSSPVPPGWYVDGQDPRRRFWDGSQWTGHFEGAALEAPDSHPLTSAKYRKRRDRSSSNSRRARGFKRTKTEKLSAAQRTSILEVELATWARKGWTVEATLFGNQAMLRKSKWRVFGRDLLLVVVTAGLWLIYVIYRTLIGRSTSMIIKVDRYGTVKTFNRTEDMADGSGY
jgi:hypothetical protein